MLLLNAFTESPTRQTIILFSCPRDLAGRSVNISSRFEVLLISSDEAALADNDTHQFRRLLVSNSRQQISNYCRTQSRLPPVFIHVVTVMVMVMTVLTDDRSSRCPCKTNTLGHQTACINKSVTARCEEAASDS